MLSFASRFVGLWFIAGALAAVAIDAAKDLAESAVAFTPIGATLAALVPGALPAAEDFVHRHIESYAGHWVWDPGAQWLLALPTWAVLGLIGFLFTWLGRRRRLRHAYA